MKALIIGGNRFLGHELALRLVAAGDSVTLFNRGTLGDALGARVERLHGDRTTGDLERLLEGRRFDAAIDFARSDPAGLAAKLQRFAPGILAFNGRKAAQVFLGRSRVATGLQPEVVGATRLFVAPSTSGAARGYWDIGVWRELAELVRGHR